jgi:dTDP-4-dehydrorhamnose reductase
LLELWGGVECTVNRVGDQYFEQTARSGHQQRLSDFDLFAQLGVKAIRQGVLWEKVAPDTLDSADWGWTDAALARIVSPCRDVYWAKAS